MLKQGSFDRIYFDVENEAVLIEFMDVAHRALLTEYKAGLMQNIGLFWQNIGLFWQNIGLFWYNTGIF